MEWEDSATLNSLPFPPASPQHYLGLGPEVTHGLISNNSFPRARRAPGSGGEAGANRKAFRVGLLLGCRRPQLPASQWGAGCAGTRLPEECEVGAQEAVGACRLTEAAEAGVKAEPSGRVESLVSVPVRSSSSRRLRTRDEAEVSGRGVRPRCPLRSPLGLRAARCS